jgi:hypothetical protein
MTAIIKMRHENFPTAFVHWREGAIVCLTKDEQEAHNYPDLLEAEAEARFIRLMYVRNGCPIYIEAIPH